MPATSTGMTPENVMVRQKQIRSSPRKRGPDLRHTGSPHARGGEMDRHGRTCPAIHVFFGARAEDVDARDKHGHDA